jgi:hypothetical protein
MGTHPGAASLVIQRLLWSPLCTTLLRTSDLDIWALLAGIVNRNAAELSKQLTELLGSNPTQRPAPV